MPKNDYNMMCYKCSSSPECREVICIQEGQSAQSARVQLMQPVPLQAQQPEARQLEQCPGVDVLEAVVIQVQAQQGGQAREG